MTGPRKGNPPPTPNPYIWEAADPGGKVIRGTFAWSSSTRAITGITGFRDTDCQFTRIIVGVGADGTPDTSTKIIDVPVGTTVLSAPIINHLSSVGLGTVDAILSLQITAAVPAE